MEGIVEVTSSRRRKVEHLQNSEKKITALSSKILTLSSKILTLSSKILTLSSTTRMQSLTISTMSSTTWLLSSTIIIHIFNSSKICTGYILTPWQQTSFPDFRVCHECEQSFVVKWPISEAAKSLVWANLSANGVSKSALFLVPTSFRQIV